MTKILIANADVITLDEEGRVLRGADISHVMVDGELLMREGELLTLDEERIMHEAEWRAWRMVGQELRAVRKYQP